MVAQVLIWEMQQDFMDCFFSMICRILVVLVLMRMATLKTSDSIDYHWQLEGWSTTRRIVKADASENDQSTIKYFDSHPFNLHSMSSWMPILVGLVPCSSCLHRCSSSSRNYHAQAELSIWMCREWLHFFKNYRGGNQRLIIRSHISLYQVPVNVQNFPAKNQGEVVRIDGSSSSDRERFPHRLLSVSQCLLIDTSCSKFEWRTIFSSNGWGSRAVARKHLFGCADRYLHVSPSIRYFGTA